MGVGDARGRATVRGRKEEAGAGPGDIIRTLDRRPHGNRFIGPRL